MCVWTFCLIKYIATLAIEIPKTYTQTYLDNSEYIAYLAKELAQKRMDIEDLSAEEQDEVTEYLSNRSNRT